VWQHEGVGRRPAEEARVTDSTSWQPPAGDPTGQPAAAFTPPGYGPASPSPAPGWTPPPKPGLIPLRPLTLGTLLGAAFQVLRRNPRPTFGFSLLITGAIYLIAFGVVGLVAFFAIARTLNATQADVDELAAGSVAMVVLSSLIPIALGIVGTAILQGIISLEVARGTVGEKLRLPGLWAAARGRIAALVGWSLLITGIVIGAIALLAVVIALIATVGGAAGVIGAVLLGLLAAAGAAVLFAWLSTKLALVPSVLMLERLPLRAAIARSWSLTNGYFWKTFGIQLLVAVIVQTVAGIISTPLQLILSLGTFLVNPNGENTGLIVAGIVVYVLTIVLAVVFGAISAVVMSATPALIYIDIRMRKEGLDLELTRFVEARQAGDQSVPDPYLVKAGTAQAAAAEGSPWS
jgi:hypothetical protein